MVTYDLMLEKQRLLGADKFSIAANANETVCLHFHFDRSWRRFDSKAAIFKNPNGKFYIIEILQNRAKIPWEVLTQVGEFELSLIGYENASVLSSDKVNIRVSESLLPEDCRTLSPSEVLFDRFRRECTEEVYRQYEDEIQELKREHAAQKLHLSEQYNDAIEAKNDELREKDAELAQIQNNNESVVRALNSQIIELNTSLAAANEKAEKWDMIDYAVSLKTAASSALWSGGKSEYSLPMLNTSSIALFANSNFSNNLKSIGLDLKSSTTFASAFLSHPLVQEITLKNTESLTSLESSFDSCTKLRNVTLGNIKACRNLRRFAYGAVSLERVSFEGTAEFSDTARAFDGCRALRVIDGEISLILATNITSMFNNCFNLETVTFKKDTIKSDIDFGKCMKLSKDSMLNIAEALSADVSRNLIFSDYAFQNNFPVGAQRSEFMSYVRDIKGWTLNLD